MQWKDRLQAPWNCVNDIKAGRACEEGDNSTHARTHSGGRPEHIKGEPYSVEVYKPVTTEFRMSVEEDLLIRGYSRHDDIGLL